MTTNGAANVLSDIYVSATQISAWKACKRRWALRTVAKIETPKSKALETGTDVDEQLQAYLSKGIEFDYSKETGYIAASGLAFFPKPLEKGKKDPYKIQHKVDMPSPSWAEVPGGFTYLGYEDVFAPQGEPSPFPNVKGDVPCVTDFKTTSNFKWAKRASANDSGAGDLLAEDPQAMIYAMDALYHTGASAVDLNWIYMRTRGGHAAKQVLVRVDRNHVAKRFMEIDQTGLAIAKQRRAFEAEGVDAGKDKEGAKKIVLAVLPPSPSACDDFGGCEYQHVCNLSPAEKNPTAFMPFDPITLDGEETTMSDTVDLMANLAARKKKTLAGPPPMTGINPPEKDLPLAKAVGVTEHVEPTAEAPEMVQVLASVDASVDAAPAVKKTRAKKTTPLAVVANDAPAGDVGLVHETASKTVEGATLNFPDTIRATFTSGAFTYEVTSSIPVGSTRVEALRAIKTDMLVVFDKAA